MLTFGSFGFFWISFTTILVLLALGLTNAPGPVDLAAFLAVWSLLIFGLFICTLKMHRLLAFTLLMVFVLAVLLVAAQLTGSSLILHLGGPVLLQNCSPCI